MPNNIRQIIKQFFAVGLLLSGLTVLPAFASNSDGFNFKKNQVSAAFYAKDFITFDFPRPPSPIFWHASTKADSGFYFMYRRTIYHTKKYFSLNIGTNFSTWFLGNQNLEALSGFLEIRWWMFHLPYFNPYISYSIAGPTFISRRGFGGAKLGENFLFQDFLGIGIQFGKTHCVNFALYLWHYSNGDIFNDNSGFDVPVVYELSYSF